MPSCPHRERLTIEYYDAVVLFSASVTTLKECDGNRHRFVEAHQASERARLHVENARMMLGIHRDEHGC